MPKGRQGEKTDLRIKHALIPNKKTFRQSPHEELFRTKLSSFSKIIFKLLVKVNMAMGHGRFEMNGTNKAIKIGRLSKRTRSAKLTGVFIANHIS